MAGELRQKFAEFILRTRCDDLPEEVVRQTKKCILDFFGVALAGMNVGLGPIVTDLFCERGGTPEATIIGNGKKLPAPSAAFVNSVLGHTLDLDDGHRFANAHAGIVVIPAALAVAERMGGTGKEFIESIVAGCETFLYIAKSMNPSHLRRGFHTTGTVGPFGAAAACAKLLGLDKKQTENALAIAGLQGSGLLEVETSGQMIKPLHSANAAQAGVMAALMAQRGAEGPDLIFEGDKGFFRAFTDESEGENTANGLGETFEIMNTYFKMYAACRHTHSTLDAINEIVTKNKIDIEQIEKIEVGIYSVAYRLTGHIRKAKTELAAKFSIPVSVGLFLVYGKAGFEEYSMDNLSNPMVQKMADKVIVTIDQERDAAFPAKRSAIVTIETKADTYTYAVDIPKGDPENPYTDDEMKQKFFINAEKVLPYHKSILLFDRIMGMENITIREFVEYIQ